MKVTVGIIDKCGVRGDATLCICYIFYWNSEGCKLPTWKAAIYIISLKSPGSSSPVLRYLFRIAIRYKFFVYCDLSIYCETPIDLQSKRSGGRFLESDVCCCWLRLFFSVGRTVYIFCIQTTVFFQCTVLTREVRGGASDHCASPKGLIAKKGGGTLVYLIYKGVELQMSKIGSFSSKTQNNFINLRQSSISYHRLKQNDSQIHTQNPNSVAQSTPEVWLWTNE